MKSLRWAAVLGALVVACSSEPEEQTPLPSGEPTAGTTIPISGGTLATGAFQGRLLAVAADSERDLVSVVDVAEARLIGQARLNPGDEPGRVAIAGGVAHVALRRGGALVSIDLLSGNILERRSVCAAPRGVDVDMSGGRVFVACQTGELVTLPLSGEEGRSVRMLEPDLRDVIFQDGHLFISTFRHAGFSQIYLDNSNSEFIPVTGNNQASVNWRTVRTSTKGQFVRVHQVAATNQVSTGSHGYGSDPCGGAIVRSNVMIQDEVNGIQMLSLSNAVLPVDVAVAPSGNEMVVVAAGAQPDQGSVLHITNQGGQWVPPPCKSGRSHPGRMVAAAYAPDGKLIVQSREPAALYVNDTEVKLSGTSVYQPGSDLFHLDVGTGIACASCHPEGQEDGQTWNFSTSKGLQPRRTIPLGGGLLQAQPFHWSADLPTMDSLLGEVMVKRMGGKTPSRQQQLHLALWLDSLPAAAPLSRETDAVARGREVFERPSVGCAECHSGSRFSDNRIVDVGTGEPLKVPSLRGLGARAPFMHNGCATTLKDRFSTSTNNLDNCGGGDAHGHTSHLTLDERNDLISYLESL